MALERPVGPVAQRRRKERPGGHVVRRQTRGRRGGQELPCHLHMSKCLMST